MAGAGGVGQGSAVGRVFTARDARRQFLTGLLLTVAGIGRRAWAQALRFRPLARPVSVPLAGLATPWRARPFIADGVTLSSAATPDQPIRISGMIVRTSADGNQPERFAAVCVKCPHEGCEVDFLPDPAKLPPEVTADIKEPLEHGVYLCPCHNSTFRADTGARLAGPAPRGLYQFRVTAVTDAAVEVAEVEEDVLLFV